MIEKNILEYSKQFEYEPEIKNSDKLGKFDKLLIAGMGGSGLIAGILRAIKPGLDIVAHHEYGLPKFVEKDKRLFIAISHSGVTEETVDFCNNALDKKLPLAIIAAKGKLIKIAEENKIPYINLPCDDIQPRIALGYILRAALCLINEKELYDDAGRLSNTLNPKKYEKKGEELSELLFRKIPVIYTSRSNQIIAYNWKIKFNETAKIPAFYNVFPEMNHNEMQGFDVKDVNKMLSENIHFIFIMDSDDHPRIKIRMDVTAKLYEKRDLKLEKIELEGKSKLERIFNSLILADWISYKLALKYGVEPERVPMVEEFKKLI
jgi:glucose/mannose-6-phosphate isomerase